jgi:hypothetical protein
MVIQTRIHDGISLKTRTYRNVIEGVNLAQYREGFFAQEPYNEWGEMFHLKGNERIMISRFGKVNPKICNIYVRDLSTTYIGHFVETIDQTDGSHGDEDYEVQIHIYYSLELEKA